MKIVIQTPHFRVRQSLLNFVQQKVERLADISNHLQEARVILKLTRDEHKQNKACEIRGIIRGNDVFAEKEANSFDEAVLKAVEAIKRQLTDRKD